MVLDVDSEALLIEPNVGVGTREWTFGQTDIGSRIWLRVGWNFER